MMRVPNTDVALVGRGASATTVEVRGYSSGRFSLNTTWIRGEMNL